MCVSTSNSSNIACRNRSESPLRPIPISYLCGCIASHTINASYLLIGWGVGGAQFSAGERPRAAGEERAGVYWPISAPYDRLLKNDRGKMATFILNLHFSATSIFKTIQLMLVILIMHTSTSYYRWSALGTMAFTVFIV